MNTLRIVQPEPIRPFTPKQIIWEVCRHFKLKKLQLNQVKGGRKIVYPRQVAMFLLRCYRNPETEKSLLLRVIGKMFNKGYDHTTVIYSVTTIKNLVETSEEVREEVNLLHRKIFGRDYTTRTKVFQMINTAPKERPKAVYLNRQW